MTHSHQGHRRLPDEFRRQWQNQETIFDKIGLKPGDTFIDIGCSNGYFALPASRIVGEKGTVYGMDIDNEAIEELKIKAANEGLTNLKLVGGDAATTIFGKALADIVFFGIDLHDFADPVTVLQNARRMIKPNGKLADLDFKKIRMDFGPPYEIRLDEAKAKEIIERAGFIVDIIEDIPPYSYLIIARPA